MNGDFDRLLTLSPREVLNAYSDGDREFQHVNLDGANLKGANLVGASFYYSSLQRVNLEGAQLTHVQLKGANLTGGLLADCRMNATDLIDAKFVGADLRNVDFTGAALSRADCSGSNMTGALLNGSALAMAKFNRTNLSKVHIYHAYFDDLDVSSFCEAGNLRHGGPSSIDSRTVIRSFRHSGLKRFMLDCGVPDVFATYMIECAQALSEPLLRSLMQSTFISYGAPDEDFARKLYEALRSHQVPVFFFPETAEFGGRIDDEVFRHINEHDRVLLICSRDSLTRAGVLNEIQETLDREARDGGATYLLPIMVDDFVLTEWHSIQPMLAERVCRRIIGDFRKTKRKAVFELAMQRLLHALMKKQP